VPLAAWLERPTLSRLALLLEQGPHPTTAVARDGRELRSAVRLAPDIHFRALRQASRTIVVTGGTGLIGSRMVAQLLARTDVEIVLVDRDPRRTLPWQERAGTRPEAKARLRAVRGDLALPLFGMSEAAFQSIASVAGLVVHVGAQVNLVASYEALQAPNVGGTHEAIRLAALAGAPLCHVSSVGVVPYGAGRLVMEDEPLEEDGPLLSGYCQTKWVAEQLVRAAMARGLQALIVRPGLTVAPERDPAQRDLLGSVLALSREVGCLPQLDMPVDLVDADYAAAAIAHLALQRQALGRTFHLTHPEPRPLSAVHRSLGADLPVRPWAEWRAQVTAAMRDLGDPRLAALAALVVRHDEAAITPATFDTRNTKAMLHAIGIRCAAVEAIAQAVWSRLA
jgi:thioester reductase-like protein